MLLGVTAFLDAKYKEFPVTVPVTGFVAGLVLQLVIGRLGIIEIAGGCALGAVFLLVAKISRNAVGYGDGLVLVSTGAFLGITGNVILLMVSLALAVLFAVVMLALKKMKRKSQIAFVPFMLGGFVAMLAFF